MPSRAATPCKQKQCNGLVRGGVCNRCGSQRREKDRTHDERRGTAHARGYGANWQKVRLMQLAIQPLCQDCLTEGRVTIGGEVHHIKAKRDGGDNSFENLMTLCKSHHSQRTARGE